MPGCSMHLDGRFSRWPGVMGGLGETEGALTQAVEGRREERTEGEIYGVGNYVWGKERVSKEVNCDKTNTILVRPDNSASVLNLLSPSRSLWERNWATGFSHLFLARGVSIWADSFNNVLLLLLFHHPSYLLTLYSASNVVI